jgi:hypothetical protein
MNRQGITIDELKRKNIDEIRIIYKEKNFDNENLEMLTEHLE